MSDQPEDANKRKIASLCWKKTTEAMAKGNFDYAVQQNQQAVQLFPDNVMYRQTLRGCEQKLYKNNKKGAKMAGMRLAGVRTKIMNARRQSNWAAMDQLAEDGLTLNPWDAQLNADLGEAAFHLGYTEVAQFAYKEAVDIEPENKEYLEKLGEIYELRSNYAEAIECWKRIFRLDPHNGKARSKITGLEAMSTMHRGGYDGANSTQQVRKTSYDAFMGSSQQMPEAVAGPGVSVEADLQHAIRKNPAEKGNYVKLADYYKQQREFAKAGEVYAQALSATGGDVNIRELSEDNELAGIRFQLDLAKMEAAKNPEDAATARNVEALKRELHLREIEVFTSRITRYPKDSGLKYELARRHMKAKDYPKAIPLLQQASADIRREGEVLVALGQCFIAENNLNLARRQFEKAAEKIDANDHQELFCQAHYTLARLCANNSERDKAEHHFNEVLSVNYGYKDAREWLEKLQRGETGSNGKQS